MNTALKTWTLPAVTYSLYTQNIYCSEKLSFDGSYRKGAGRKSFRGFTLSDTTPCTHYSVELLLLLLKNSRAVWLGFGK